MARFRYIHPRESMVDPNGGRNWSAGEVREVSGDWAQRLRKHPDCFEESLAEPTTEDAALRAELERDMNEQIEKRIEEDIDLDESAGQLPNLNTMTKANMQELAMRTWGKELPQTMKAKEMRDAIRAMANGTRR